MVVDEDAETEQRRSTPEEKTQVEETPVVEEITDEEVQEKVEEVAEEVVTEAIEQAEAVR